MRNPDVTHPLNAARRAIDSRWTIGTTTDRFGETVEVEVELTTRHDRERKRYVSSITHQERGETVVSWSSDNAYGVLIVEQAARYSAKRLAEIHAEALDDITVSGFGRDIFDAATAQVAP